MRNSLRNGIFAAVEALILSSAMMLLQGCFEPKPVSEYRNSGPQQVSSSSSEIVCVDPNATQCMSCDPRTHECHFPVFKLR